MTSLESETIALARSYIGLREQGKNTGPEIDKMLGFVRCSPGDPWCSAYVSYCICKAAVTVPPTFKPSASALRLLARNPDLEVPVGDVAMLLQAGTPLVFIMDFGGGKGHCGFAIATAGDGCFTSIESNTGPGPSVPAKDRDGDGTYERSDRKIASVLAWLRIR